MTTVPTLSIVYIVITALICFCVPLAALIVMRVRFKGPVLPALLGAVVFYVFVLVLEAAVHRMVLQGSSFGAVIMGNPVFYMLYGGLMAGIFEETGRLLAFLMLRRKFSGVRTALSYGIGHGGIEAILLTGVTMVNNLILSASLSSGGPLTASLPADMLEQMSRALIDTPSYVFLLSGAERLFAMSIHIALSVLVWMAVTKRGPFWLYPVAIGLHAVINFPAALIQTGVISDMLVFEGLMFLMTLGLCALTTFLYVYYTRKDLPKPGRR